MTKVKISRGKFEGLIACSDEKGLIAAVAIDQRGSLQKSMVKCRGEGGIATSSDLVQFKKAVVKVLTPHASAVLVDPEFGLEALSEKARGAGVLLAYEKTGYDATVRGRLPDVLPEWSVRRLVEAGASAIKILLYYNAFDDPHTNLIKHAFIERIGAECVAYDVPFFLEPICYDDNLDDKSLEFAHRKPDLVIRYMEEFSKPQYGVDILKVEPPVNMKFVEGTSAFAGTAAYTRNQAMSLFRNATSAAKKPFIYLSAGVTAEIFRETLELAAEAGTDFSGVLCGRATWQDGIPVYVRDGYAALVNWLQDKGVENITSLNEVLAQGAQPWWKHYGGLENIEVVG
jgi:tagatose 1,6-diphosphate aldolase